MGILHRLSSRRGPEVREAHARLLHRMGVTAPPIAVQWIATKACDLHCPHCYSHAGKKTEGELDADEAKRLIVDELVHLERPTLVVAGGEPLLHPGFASVIEYAHARGVPWALHSHGGRVAAHEDLLRRCPPVMAAISLDGPRAHHDAFRGRVGSFDAAIAAIATLRRAGCPEVVAGTTVTRQNADLLVDLAPIVIASGAHSWGLHLVTPEGRGHDHEEILPDAAQLGRVAALARRLRSLVHVELDNEWGSAGPDDAFYRDDPFRCGAGRFACVVSATGEVVPCTTTDLAESAGNVRDRALSQIWASGFHAFRGQGDPLRSDTRDCWLQTRNGRSCRGAAFFGSRVVELSPRPAAVRPEPGPHPASALLASGRVAPRVLNRIATALVVVFGVGLESDEARAQDGGPKPAADPEGKNEAPAPKATESLPEHVGEESIGGYRRWESDELSVRPLKQALDRGALPADPKAVEVLRSWGTALPSRLATLVTADLDAIAATTSSAPVACAELTATLREIEERGTFDAWFHAWIWRKAAKAPGTREERIALHERLHGHARLVATMTRARFEVKAERWNPRAWMSKAGPSKEALRAEKEVRVKLLEAARRLHAATDVGPWRTDATVELWVAEGSAPLTVVRGADRLERASGSALRMSRLDLLLAPGGDRPVKLEHAWLGRLSLPKDGAVSVFGLPALLGDEAREKARASAEAAVAGDEAATSRLELALPLVHEAARAALEKAPDGKGAPRVRTMLALFHDRVLGRE